MSAKAETDQGNPDSAESRQGIPRRAFLKGLAGLAGAAVIDHYLPPRVRRLVPGFDYTLARVEAADLPYPLDYPLRPPDLEASGSLSPDIPHGWFFRQQAVFEGMPKEKGYIVYNDTQNNIPLWKAFQDLGGRDIFGYAITNRWQTADGKWIQLFEKAGIQYDPATQRSEYVNALDMMTRAGMKDNWYNIPDSRDDVWDSSLPEAENKRNPESGTLEANQIDAFFSPRFLPNVPPERIEALKAFFLKDPNWYTTLGLPTGNGVYVEGGIIKKITVRTQRGAVQMGLDPMPGSTLKPWEPFRLSGSRVYRDLVKDLGRKDLIPEDALEADYNPYGVGGNESPEQIAKQAFNQRLKELLAYKRVENVVEYPNALGLNEQEVNGYIAGTWGEDGIKSFKILRGPKTPECPKGKPLVVLVTGGDYGLQTTINFETAVTQLNEIDPTTLDLLASKHGLRAITYTVAPGNTFTTKHPTYGATWEFRSGILEFNERAEWANHSSVKALGLMLMESRGMYTDQYLVDGKNIAPDKLDENRGIDKGMYLLQWAEEHKAKLTEIKNEYGESYYGFLTRMARSNNANYANAAKNAA